MNIFCSQSQQKFTDYSSYWNGLKRKKANDYVMLSLRASIKAMPKKVIRLHIIIRMNWNKRNEKSGQEEREKCHGAVTLH